MVSLWINRTPNDQWAYYDTLTPLLALYLLLVSAPFSPGKLLVVFARFPETSEAIRCVLSQTRCPTNRNTCQGDILSNAGAMRGEVRVSFGVEGILLHPFLHPVSVALYDSTVAEFAVDGSVGRNRVGHRAICAAPGQTTSSNQEWCHSVKPTSISTESNTRLL